MGRPQAGRGREPGARGRRRRVHDTAFTADYYPALVRACYDGRMPWLNTVEHGRPYRPGDIWGSVGGWFAGRWHTPAAEGYIARVKQMLRDRTWRRPGF